MPDQDPYDSEADQDRAPVQDGESHNLAIDAESDETKTEDSQNQSGKGKGRKGRKNKKPDNRPERGERVFGSGRLKSEEENATYGSSAGDDIDDKLNKGYTKGSGRKTFTSKMWNSKGDSALKKKIAIAGAAAGGSLIGGILVFLALLPLKIEHLITNAQGKFAAASVQAIGTETDNAFSAWISKEILPNLLKGTCHSTIDATCVSVAKGDNNPVHKLWNGWKDSHLEQKLATKYNIVFGNKNGKLYVNFPGASLSLTDAQIADLQAGKLSIFDIGEGDQVKVTRSEFRDAYKRAMKDATKWDKVYFRFKVGKLAERKYGVHRCIVACNAKDKFADSVADKKFAAKAAITRRVIGTFSDSAGLLTECIISGAECSPNLDEAKAGDEERRSPAQKKLDAELVKYAAQFGEDKLADLVKKAEDINKKGLTKYIASEIASKVAVQVGGDAAGAAAGAAAEKIVPVVGWVFFASTVIATAHEIGPMVRQINYSASTAAAVDTFMADSTVVSEYKSNHMDLTEFGSFVTALSTNLDGSTSDKVDYTQSPLYSKYFGAGQPAVKSASLLSSLLPGTAFADSTTPAPQSQYTCNDGKPPTGNNVVCPEEQFARGNDVANQISSVVDSIPVLPQVAGVVSSIGSTVGGAIGDVFSAACNVVPGCNSVVATIGGLIGDLINWLTSGLIVSPISDHLSGARQGDLVIAGADALGSSSCQIQLGCSQATPAQAAAMQNKQAEQDKADFMAQPFFARMFDTSSTYSLVGHLADAMPTTLTDTAAEGIGSLLTNPFSKFASVLTGAFSTNASAATATAGPDPFGIPQSWFPPDAIPSDPEQYWTDHCQGDWKTTWLNNQTMDPGSGTAVASTPEPCLLIQATVASSGATSDSSLATLGDPDSTAAAASSTGTPSATATAGYGATAEQLVGLPPACSAGNATGAIKLLCFGAKYRNMVAYNEVHPYTGKYFSQTWPSNNSLTLDCSLFVGTEIWEAFGQDFTTTSQEYVNNKTLFQQIPLNQAQPGDLAVSSHHIAIVNVPNVSVLDSSTNYGKPANGQYLHPGDLDIHNWNSDFTYALRYIGPGL